MNLSNFRVARLSSPKTILSIVLQTTIILLATVYPLLFNPQKANATTTEAFVMFDRISSGATVAGWACMKSTATTQTNVVLVFPAGWTISPTAGNWTVTTANLPSDPGGGTPTAWPGISTASGVSGLSVMVCRVYL